jgi:hypothetical protein
MTNGVRSQQCGIILPIFAIVSIIFVMFLGLLIGGGSLFFNKSRLHKVANFAAIGALESYMRYDDVNSATLPKDQFIASKMQKSFKTTKHILESNKFLFSRKNLGDLEIYDGNHHDHKSELALGLWFEEEPTVCNVPTGCGCDKVNGVKPKKPCFLSIPASLILSEGIEVNATKINVKTPKDAFFAPFASIFGKSFFSSETSSIAKAQERCTVFAVDISSSSFSDTHEFMGGFLKVMNEPFGGPWLWMTNPNPDGDNGQLGNYAIGVAKDTTPIGYRNSDYEYDCAAPVPPTPNEQEYNVSQPLINYAYWCHLLPTRPIYCTHGLKLMGICDWHYRSDYERVLTAEGEYYIDKFRSPEPLTSIFLAINAGLRSLKSRLSAVDRIALIPFASREYSPIPPIGLTKNLDFMIDMTDLRRAGKRVYKPTGWETEDVKYPNFIDRNWFPMDDRTIPDGARGGTNIARVLNDSINRLVNPNFCSPTAKKTIVIATDGIYSQYYNTSNRSVNWDKPLPILRWRNLLAADDLLFKDFKLKDNILKRLIDSKISLATILVGDMVQPNFYNIRKDGTEKEFLSILEMGSNGFRGMPDPLASPPEYPISNIDVEPPKWLPKDLLRSNLPCSPINYNKEECALMSMNWGIPGVEFRRPNGVFAQMSILSSGLFCPIAEPYRNGNAIDSNCYDENKQWRDGEPHCSREELSIQVKSTYGEELGGQAANCVSHVLGNTPFVLAESELYN